MNMLSSEELTKVKTRSIAEASAMKIELVDGNRTEYTCLPKPVADATLSPILRTRAFRY
jgi:predicted aspartyl protease